MASGRDRLIALARWVDRFQDPGFELGHWAGGDRLTDGSIQMPWYAFSDEGMEFHRELYDNGWIIPFDWGAWAQQDGPGALLASPQLVATADEDTLSRLLTVVARSERFSEGSFAQALESGLLVAIAERAGALGRS